MMQGLGAAISGGLVRAVALSRGDWGLLGLLRRDHTEIRSRLHTLSKNLDDGGTRGALFRELHALLSAHLSAEDEVLYHWHERNVRQPAQLREARASHQSIMGLLEDLADRPVTDPAWPGQFESLQRLVALHFQDEENHLFDAVRRDLGRKERADMAAQYKRILNRRLEERGTVPS